MTIELREEARRREREREAIDKRRAEFIRDLRAIASIPEGVRLFRWLLEQGKIFDSGYIPGQAGAYQAGKRAQALHLWRLLRENIPLETFTAIILFPPDIQDDWQERERDAAGADHSGENAWY